jgi:hypothetical protein
MNGSGLMRDLTWRKSSYSGNGATGNCVEPALGALRDSKHPDGSVLSVDVTALVAAVKAGQIGWPTTSALPEPIAIVM